MQVVIKIDTVDYEYIKNGCIIPIKIDNHIYDAIRKGTTLPKGHGRLIDENNLIKEIEDDIVSNYFDMRDWIRSSETFIEADKESEE